MTLMLSSMLATVSGPAVLLGRLRCSVSVLLGLGRVLRRGSVLLRRGLPVLGVVVLILQRARSQ